MKLSTKILALGTIGLLSACMEQTGDAASSDAAIAAMLAGKTAVAQSSGFAIDINADGSMGGEGVDGRWEIKNGKWCRELTANGREFPYECQGLAVAGDQMSITRADGSVAVYTLQ